METFTLAINEIITIVFSSSVIAAIIPACIVYISNKRATMSNFIIEEKRLWRHEILDIIKDLESSRQKNKNNAIIRLKKFINPYGINDELEIHDAHIWKVLAEIEKTENEDECNKKIEELITYLQLLLKYDWDKCKRKAGGDICFYGVIITLTVGILYLIYKHFIDYGMCYNETFLVAVVVLLGYPLVLGIVPFKEVLIGMYKYIWGKSYCLVIKIALIVLLSIGILCEGGLPIYVLCAYNFQLEYLSTSQGYLDLSIIVGIIVLIFTFSRNLSKADNERKYIEEVKKYKKSFNNVIQENIMENKNK